MAILPPILRKYRNLERESCPCRREPIADARRNTAARATPFRSGRPGTNRRARLMSYGTLREAAVRGLPGDLHSEIIPSQMQPYGELMLLSTDPKGREVRPWASEAEAVQGAGTALPVGLDLDRQLHVGARLQLLAHGGPDPFQHLAALADDDPLLRLPLDEDLHADAGPLPLRHPAGDRVGQLLPGHR